MSQKSYTEVERDARERNVRAEKQLSFGCVDIAGVGGMLPADYKCHSLLCEGGRQLCIAASPLLFHACPFKCMVLSHCLGLWGFKDRHDVRIRFGEK